MKSPPDKASGSILIEKSTKTVSPTTFVTLYSTAMDRSAIYINCDKIG